MSQFAHQGTEHQMSQALSEANIQRTEACERRHTCEDELSMTRDSLDQCLARLKQRDQECEHLQTVMVQVEQREAQLMMWISQVGAA